MVHSNGHGDYGCAHELARVPSPVFEAGIALSHNHYIPGRTGTHSYSCEQGLFVLDRFAEKGSGVTWDAIAPPTDMAHHLTESVTFDDSESGHSLDCQGDVFR
jgi:hypothetical protein